MESKQDWKRLHDEHYRRGVSTEERIGVVLLFLVPIVFLVSIAVEVWGYHNGH
jgi:hypothetical protein